MSGKSVNFDNKKILKSEFYKSKKVAKIDDIDVNPIQDGLFQGCSRMVGGAKRPPFIKSVTHILK